MNCLQFAIQKHAHRRRPRANLSNQKAATIEEFNKKLTETDSYLQILINQFRKVDDKIKNASSDTEKAQLTTLKEQSGYMLDSIKHTIVLLQIAKVDSTLHFVPHVLTPICSTTRMLNTR